MKVQFYLTGIEKEFTKEMPFRINIGDGFYFDDFITDDELKAIGKEGTKYIIQEESIQYAVSVLFGKHTNGVIYQQVYLSHDKDLFK